MGYLTIKKEDIPPNIFKISQIGSEYSLIAGTAKPIIIELPFILDEKVAKIVGMLLDGSLSKELRGGMFSQKKDISKNQEFIQIIEELFKIKGHFHNKATPQVSVSNTTIAKFFYYCLDMNKSDEPTKIPKWIWLSEQSVKIEYLRYAFAMEGSIKDPRLGNKEIKFHSCDNHHTLELKRFFKDCFNISFKKLNYYISGYGWKYYLYTNNKSDFEKFGKIGFALDSHQARLEEELRRLKPKAWEITLLTLTQNNLVEFKLKEVLGLFPELICKRSLHERVSTLVAKG